MDCSSLKEKWKICKMKEHILFGFQVQIDEVATREWYEKADEWNCECEDCRHFIDLAKRKELPIPVMEILEQFGIVPEKATYVCEMITEEHKVLYQFSYRMAGTIVKERIDGTKDLGWGEVYCGHEPYPHGAPGFPKPHFDLEFWVRLPKAYKYSDIADFLMQGREIEFAYKGRKYSITNHSGFWHLCDDTEHILLETVCRFEEKEILVSKIAVSVIDDMKIQDIFDRLLYDRDRVDII